MEQYDFKACRSYKYSDKICRLCKIGVEDIDHVVNKCSAIDREYELKDYLCPVSKVEVESIAERCSKFLSKVEETISTRVSKKGSRSARTVANCKQN